VLGWGLAVWDVFWVRPVLSSVPVIVPMVELGAALLPSVPVAALVATPLPSVPVAALVAAVVACAPIAWAPVAGLEACAPVVDPCRVRSWRGAAEAGAVFVAVDRLDGTYDLYGPAPQAFFEEPVTGRLFERLLAGVDRATVFERLEREKRMDPDHWVIELNSQSGETGLEVVEEE